MSGILNLDAFLNVLPMVVYGMAGIFIVTAVIYAVVAFLNKIFAPKRGE
jgi:ABC-type phosphate transport system permease subunit